MEMIERHYFKGTCIREFSFKFGFIIPNSTNSWELVYDFPDLSEELKDEIRQSPWEVKSDSYFFANNVLMIHNRAEYNYSELDWIYEFIFKFWYMAAAAVVDPPERPVSGSADYTQRWDCTRNLLAALLALAALS